MTQVSLTVSAVRNHGSFWAGQDAVTAVELRVG